MNQPSLFRDALRIECSLCGDIIQPGDGQDAPLAGGICEECERKEEELAMYNGEDTHGR